MTYRGSPLTTPEQIADIYEKLRRLKPGITIEQIVGLLDDHPCDCGCTTIPGSKSFFEAGTIAVETSNETWWIPFPLTIRSVRATVKTSTGNNVVDINVNGTTIFTDQTHRPSLATGVLTGLASGIDVPNMVLGDYLSFDVDEGSGSDLSIEIGYVVECGDISIPTIGTSPGPTGPCGGPDLPYKTGLQVWLNACSIAASDGDRLTSWPDISGNGNDFTCAGGGGEPVFNTGILNSQPGVKWDGNTTVSKGLLGPDLSAAMASGATMFIVWSFGPVPPYNDYVIFTSDPNLGFQHHDQWWRGGGGAAGSGAWSAFRTSRLAYPGGGAMATSGAHYATLCSDGSRYQLYSDGVDQGAQAAAYEAPSSPQLGLWVTGVWNAAFNGHIHEFILFDSALSDANRGLIEGYLRAKYGL